MCHSHQGVLSVCHSHQGVLSVCHSHQGVLVCAIATRGVLMCAIATKLNSHGSLDLTMPLFVRRCELNLMHILLKFGLALLAAMVLLVTAKVSTTYLVNKCDTPLSKSAAAT